MKSNILKILVALSGAVLSGLTGRIVFLCAGVGIVCFSELLNYLSED